MPRPDRYTSKKKGKHRKPGVMDVIQTERHQRIGFVSEIVRRVLSDPTAERFPPDCDPTVTHALDRGGQWTLCGSRSLAAYLDQHQPTCPLCLAYRKNTGK